ncbi:MAG: ornithine cyclodeaminase family protein [Myxococcaceae bacterium]|nr:ornithine cyclodeaminase family protein [Myxococcaceae bacterium]
MLTTILSRAEVSRHMQALHLLSELRQAFTSRGPGGDQASSFEPPGVLGATVVRQATQGGIPAWSLSIRAAQPTTSKSSGATLHLYDTKTGHLLALMDAGHLSSLRAAVVGALAADVLASPQTRTVALLGGGPAVSSALKALRLVRSLERITLFDADLVAATEQSFKLQTTLSAAVRACDTAEEAVHDAELIVLTGSVPLPTDTLKPGAHVTVMNAELNGASPLPVPLLSRARCFCDDLRPPLAWAPALKGTLAQVLAGAVPARTSPDDVTVFLSIGPPFLELVAAWHVYESARRDETLTRIDLSA